MRVLQICSKPPWPKIDGGCLAKAAMTEVLQRCGFQVRMITAATHKHPFQSNFWPSEVLSSTKPIAVEIDTRIRSLSALKSLLMGGSYNLERFDSPALHQGLATILKAEEFDVVHLEGLYAALMLPTIRKHSKAKVVLRAHNVEYVIWQRLANTEVNAIKKFYLNILAKRLRNEEIRLCQSMDGIVAITPEDAALFNQMAPHVPIEVVPMTLPIQNFGEMALPKPLSIYHLGSMNWLPNQEAIRFFVRDVWPLIEAKFPKLICRFAGRGMPHDLIEKSSKGLEIMGEVPDAQMFMLNHAVLVVPLLSGSGMRVKMIEAMSAGRAVITTSIGLEGIDAEHGTHLLIANSPQAFVDCISQLMATPNLADQLGKNARQLMQQRFSHEAAARTLGYFYGQLTKA